MCDLTGVLSVTSDSYEIVGSTSQSVPSLIPKDVLKSGSCGVIKIPPAGVAGSALGSSAIKIGAIKCHLPDADAMYSQSVSISL